MSFVQPLSLDLRESVAVAILSTSFHGKHVNDRQAFTGLDLIREKNPYRSRPGFILGSNHVMDKTVLTQLRQQGRLLAHSTQENKQAEHGRSLRAQLVS